jgi:hypothetical protein
MRTTKLVLMTVGLGLLAAAPAQSRVSYGDSQVFSLDTITAVGDGDSAVPAVTALSAAYPNPFNPRVTIAYQLAAAGPIELAVFDARGRLVRVLESGWRSAGRHRANWDGLDATGRAAPAGTYLCRLTGAHGTRTLKLGLAK